MNKCTGICGTYKCRQKEWNPIKCYLVRFVLFSQIVKVMGQTNDPIMDRTGDSKESLYQPLVSESYRNTELVFTPTGRVVDKNSTDLKTGNWFKKHCFSHDNVTGELRILNTSCLCTPGTVCHLHKYMNSTCRMFEFIISFILVGITCLFGFVGNVLSIVTLRRDSLKSVTTFLLSALAIADLCFQVPAIFVIMIPTYCEFYNHCAQGILNAIPYMEQYGWAMASTCHSCTIYMTVLVAFHRYIGVCCPGLVQRYSRPTLVKIEVAAVPIFSLFYNAPRFFEYKVRSVVYHDISTKINRTETTKLLSTVGKNHYYQFVYKNLSYFVLIYFVPLIILVFVSYNLIKILLRRRATLPRIGSTSSNCSQNRRDDSITLVLIIIIAAFFVCQTPTVVQRLLLAASAVNQAEYACGDVYFYLEHVADFMALLNSSTNFVIYIIFSPHFCQTLKMEVLNCSGDNSPIAINLRHLSHILKTRKSPSEDNNAAQIEEVRDQNDMNSNPQINRHVTGNASELGNKAVPENHWLLPPEPTNCNSNSHSTQVTSLMTSSNEDGDNHPGVNHAGDEEQIRHIDSSTSATEEERQVIIPLIALERASSIIEST